MFRKSQKEAYLASHKHLMRLEALKNQGREPPEGVDIWDEKGTKVQEARKRKVVLSSASTASAASSASSSSTGGGELNYLWSRS